MKRSSVRLCSLSLALILLLSCAVPVAFASSPSVSSEITGFWESLVNSFNQSVTGSGPLSFLAKYAISSLAADVCAQSEDGHHHGNLTGKTYHLDSVEYEAKCTACGELFRVSEDTVSAAYNEYVSTLPSSGVSSAGNLLWQPNWKDAGYASLWNPSTRGWKVMTGAIPESPDLNSYSDLYAIGPCLYYNFPYQVLKAFTGKIEYVWWTAPVSGYYRKLETERLYTLVVDADDSISEESSMWSDSKGENVTAGGIVSIADKTGFSVSSAHRCLIRFTTPVYSITPVSDSVITNNYTIDTRVTNFVGNFYNETTNNYYNNITVVNETTNKYYDILSGNYINFKSWTYDYTSRTYILTLDDDTTVAVQFGPDVLTITHPDNTTDTFHYTLPGSSTPEEPDTPSSCDHDWLLSYDPSPSCLEGGIEYGECKKCHSMYKRPVSAVGHAWTVKAHENTVYDETGEIIQQGYTLYECSRCGEQFYTDTVAAPPDFAGSSSILAWLKDFQTWLGEQLKKIGGGGYNTDDLTPDPGIEDEDGNKSDGFSFFDLLGALLKGAWGICKGVVRLGGTTFTAFVSGLTSIPDGFGVLKPGNSDSVFHVESEGSDFW